VDSTRLVELPGDEHWETLPAGHANAQGVLSVPGRRGGQARGWRLLRRRPRVKSARKCACSSSGSVRGWGRFRSGAAVS